MGDAAGKSHVTLRAEIVAWLDDHQPGFVRCRFSDRFGAEWFVDDKLPVVTAADLWPPFPFPQPAKLYVTVVEERLDMSGRPFAVVDLGLPSGLETTTGETRIEVFSDQLEPDEKGR